MAPLPNYLLYGLSQVNKVIQLIYESYGLVQPRICTIQNRVENDRFFKLNFCRVEKLKSGWDFKFCLSGFTHFQYKTTGISKSFLSFFVLVLQGLGRFNYLGIFFFFIQATQLQYTVCYYLTLTTKNMYLSFIHFEKCNSYSISNNQFYKPCKILVA